MFICLALVLVILFKSINNPNNELWNAKCVDTLRQTNRQTSPPKNSICCNIEWMRMLAIAHIAAIRLYLGGVVADSRRFRVIDIIFCRITHIRAVFFSNTFFSYWSDLIDNCNSIHRIQWIIAIDSWLCYLFVFVFFPIILVCIVFFVRWIFVSILLKSAHSQL